MAISSETGRTTVDPTELALAQSESSHFVRGIVSGTSYAEQHGDVVAGTVIQADPELDSDFNSLVYLGNFKPAHAVLLGIYAGIEEVVRRNHE